MNEREKSCSSQEKHTFDAPSSSIHLPTVCGGGVEISAKIPSFIYAFLFTPGEKAAGDVRGGDKVSKALANREMASSSRRITTLEMKELNERQRAEHAHKMCEHARNSLRHAEERNAELEAKFAEVNSCPRSCSLSLSRSLCRSFSLSLSLSLSVSLPRPKKTLT